MNITGDHDEKPEHYARKKTVAQGFMDTALLAANTAQLKIVLDTGDKDDKYYTPLLALLIISIVIQILVALMLAMIYSSNLFDKPNEQDYENTEDYNEAKEDWESQANSRKRVRGLNNGVTLLMVCLAFINIVISSLGLNATAALKNVDLDPLVGLIKNITKTP